jgi:hypothetical protein
MRALSLAFLFIVSFSAAADAYGTYVQGKTRQGHAFGIVVAGYSIQLVADDTAIERCVRYGLTDCTIVSRFHGVCAATTRSQIVGGEYFATGIDEQTAINASVSQCWQKHAPTYCIPGARVCDRSPSQLKTNEQAPRQQSDYNLVFAVMLALGVGVAFAFIVPQFWKSLRGLNAKPSQRHPSPDQFQPFQPNPAPQPVPPSSAAAFAPSASPAFPPAPAPAPPLSIFPAPASAPDDRAVRMQASINHTQERGNFYVTLKLLFSPGALLLINARQLHATEIIKGFDHPPMHENSIQGLVWTVRLIRGFTPLVCMGAFIWGVAGGGTAAGLLMFGMLGAFAWTFGGPSKIFLNRIEKSFTIGHFLKNPEVRLWAPDPTSAKELDETIRERLQLLKLYLEDSKTLPASETFDV